MDDIPPFEQLIKLIEDVTFFISKPGINVKTQTFVSENLCNVWIKMNIHNVSLVDIFLDRFTGSINYTDMDSDENMDTIYDNGINMDKVIQSRYNFILHNDIKELLRQLFLTYEDRTKNPINPLIWERLDVNPINIC
jgi:phage terminase large subunit-like protein